MVEKNTYSGPGHNEAHMHLSLPRLLDLLHLKLDNSLN